MKADNYPNNCDYLTNRNTDKLETYESIYNGTTFYYYLKEKL